LAVTDSYTKFRDAAVVETVKPRAAQPTSNEMTLTKRIIPCIDVDLDDEGNAAVYTGVNFEDL